MMRNHSVKTHNRTTQKTKKMSSSEKDRINGVMVIVLTPSAVDRGLEH
jgi:hypothetical protein